MQKSLTNSHDHLRWGYCVDKQLWPSISTEFTVALTLNNHIKKLIHVCMITRNLHSIRVVVTVPSTWRGNQDGYRCSSSALPISGWRFCDALSDRCFAGGSLILCVSLPGPEAVLAWSRFPAFHLQPFILVSPSNAAPFLPNAHSTSLSNHRRFLPRNLR